MVLLVVPSPELLAVASGTVAIKFAGSLALHYKILWTAFVLVRPLQALRGRFQDDSAERPDP